MDSRDLASNPTDADVVYLSPHLDDAVLSCGGRIGRESAAGLRVVVWTLFTADEPDEPPSAFATTLRRWWNLPPGEVMIRRREEDLAACARLGARAVHAGRTEAPYRRDAENRPLYASLAALFGKLHQCDDLLESALVESLALLRGIRVNAPLGVGGHVDHQLLRRAVTRAGLDARYYEEFPYVEWKWGALRRALGRQRDWEAETTPLTQREIADRIDAIAHYRSQLPALFRTEARLGKQVRRAVRRAGGERLWRPRSPRSTAPR